MTRRSLVKFSRVALPLVGALAMAAPAAQADTGSGAVSLTASGVAATENFDTLSNIAGSTTNTALPTGWYLTESGGGARDNEQYAVDTGASTTGDTYSYGSAASTDRALGALRSGTLIPLFGARVTNATGATITSLAISYTGEEWRLGTAARTDQLSFEYSLDATSLGTGTWTGVPALNFTTPDTAVTGAKNGNAVADRTARSSTITGLSIPSGSSFYIRWVDLDATGADDGLAVDDFSITATAPTAVGWFGGRARRSRHGSVISWEAASSSALGFDVLRVRGGRRVRLNRTRITAALDAGRHRYVLRDRAGRRGDRYLIAAYDSAGSRTLHGPYRAARAAR
jgi:hypothetical protein